MQIRMWGVRGSYPVARADMLRYGGNTAAVEVRVGSSLIVLDAGTGLRPLGQVLAHSNSSGSQQIHLFISHTHWDHIVGLPFFAPLYDAHTSLTIYGPRRADTSLRETIEDAMRSELSPRSLRNVKATLQFQEIDDGDHVGIDGEATVCATRVNHPARALGYRVESTDGVLAYVPDTGPFHSILFGDDHVAFDDIACGPAERRQLEVMRQQVCNLAAAADWLIYDTQLTDEEYPQRQHWGHSTPSQAIDLAAEAQARRLLLFHHDPHRSDAQVEALLEAHRPLATRHGLDLAAAYEGMCLSKAQPL